MHSEHGWPGIKNWCRRICSVQAGRCESSAGCFQVPWTKGNCHTEGEVPVERLISAWSCARQLLPAWAAFQWGMRDRDGCRLEGCGQRCSFGWAVMGSGSRPCLQSVPLPASTAWMPPHGEATSSPTDLGQNQLTLPS